MIELLRFTSGSSIGVSFIIPAKKEFVFYDNKLEVYNKGKLIKTVNYDDIIEVVVMKTWQNNVFINCKPIGFNIYKVSDEICNKIKEITSNKKDNNNLDNISVDDFEKNKFIRIEKDKKIMIKIYNNGSVVKSCIYNFKTNIINTIPETDIKFAIALEQDNNEYVHVFVNKFNSFIQNCDSPTRTFFPGLTDVHNFSRYIFEYKQKPILKIGLDENCYLEMSVESVNDLLTSGQLVYCYLISPNFGGSTGRDNQIIVTPEAYKEKEEIDKELEKYLMLYKSIRKLNVNLEYAENSIVPRKILISAIIDDEPYNKDITVW